MKIKDIESKLKSEQKSQNIPDVLQRAKKAPINRLLDGQTPLRAFDKQTAVRLLWCAMFLLVAAVLAIWAGATIPDGGQGKASLAYVRIIVVSEGETTEYGIVTEDFERVAALVQEKQNDTLVCQNLQKNGYNVEAALKEVYQPKEGDRITICVVSNTVPNGFIDGVKAAFSADGIEVSTSENDSATIATLRSLVGDDSADVDTLIKKYLEKF